MDLLICETCGQQFGTASVATLDNQCFICNDPRQFVRQHGQTWTTLGDMQSSSSFRNVISETLPRKLWSIYTEPKFGIGQRAIFVQEGNVLWDCIAYLDSETLSWLERRGGVKAICISHPHYYTTSVQWAKALGCKIKIFAEDEPWLTRPSDKYDLLDRSSAIANGLDNLHHHVRITDDLTLVKIGGHFDGSAVLYSRKDRYILVGDTISLTAANRRVTIMWSYPNMIPLDVATIRDICWPRLSVLDYDSIYAKFIGEDMVSDAHSVTEASLSFYCAKLGGSLVK